jgi:DNA primase
VKIVNYIQGHDQLKFERKWLVVLASLKDLMAFKKLKFPNIECIAPESENSMLTDKQVAFYKKRYGFISILFDNDVAGRKSARKYYQKYGIPYTEFDVEKDIADCIREHGLKNTRIFLQPHLIETKDEYLEKYRTFGT